MNFYSEKAGCVEGLPWMEGADCGLWYLLLAPVWGFILSLGLFVFIEGKNTELFLAD